MSLIKKQPTTAARRSRRLRTSVTQGTLNLPNAASWYRADRIVLNGSSEVTTLTDSIGGEDFVSPSPQTTVDQPLNGLATLKLETLFRRPNWAQSFPVTIALLCQWKHTNNFSRSFGDPDDIIGNPQIFHRTSTGQIRSGGNYSINGTNGLTWHVPNNEQLSVANSSTQSWHWLFFDFGGGDTPTTGGRFSRDSTVVHENTAQAWGKTEWDGDLLSASTSGDVRWADIILFTSRATAQERSDLITYANNRYALTLV